MRKKSLLTAAAALTVMAGLFTGCSMPTNSADGGNLAERCAAERAAKADQPLKIGVALTGLNSNAVFIDAVAAVKAEAQAAGHEVITADTADPEAGVRAIENFITAGADVIISQIFQEELIASLLPRIQENCIVFGSYDAVTEGADYSILADNAELGRMIGQAGGAWMMENNSGKGKAAIMGYDPLEFLKVRSDGIKEGFLEACPTCEIAQEFEIVGFPDEGVPAGENLLQAHPDVKIVMGINDGGMLGVYEAFKAAGLNDPASTIALIGCDASLDGLSAVEDAGIYRATVSLNLVDEIVALYERSVRTAQSGQIATDERVVEYPMTVITKDNLGDA